jgi:L-asparaginase II
MTDSLRVEATRGGIVESLHRVSLAVVDREGRLIASAGDPGLVTFWRSAAKPFQAMPLVAHGAAEHFGFGSPELALACASHSSEPVHRMVAGRMLASIEVGEEALACGPHPPLSPLVANEVVRQGVVMTPVWSNCSGKHAGMLALARFHGWPLAGYQTRGHPVQEAVLHEIERWTGVPSDRMVLGVDGCTVVSFGLPLLAMALAYARFGVSEEAPARRLRRAMTEEPLLTAGQGRLETDLVLVTAGRAIAKIGADGVYCASLPEAGLGVALKIEDGDMASLGTALLASLQRLAARYPLGFEPGTWPPALSRHAGHPILNTRGAPTGAVRAVGELRFHD